MRRLTRRQLLISLIFPVGITVWAVLGYAGVGFYAGFVPVYSIQWSYMIACVVCGIIPIILTITLGIDTGQYMTPRVLMSCCALAFTTFTGEFLSEAMFSGAVVLLLIAIYAASGVYFFKLCPTKFSEWIVIFLANPVLAALIYYVPMFIPEEPII